jgi:ferric-dicitrate binding protein FerR (iron transport regulator)
MENFDKKIKDKVLSFEYTKMPMESEMSKMFEQFQQEQIPESPFVSVHNESKVRKLHPFYLKIAAAVAVLLIVGYSSYYLNSVDVYMSNGNSIAHQLPDGSMVDLNADTRISYNKLSWLINRKISLEGEAFFQVQKGKKFSVESDFGKTQVMGTSFNVYSRDRDYKVECISGRVKVSYNGAGKSVFITKETGVRYGETQKGEVYSFNNDTRIDWRKGEFYFNNESIINVLDEFSRQYNIKVKVDEGYDEMKYTGYFNNESLEAALKMICDPLELKYHIRKEYIEIIK